MLCNIFTTDNSLHGSFHTREVLVVILLQSIRLGNSFVNLSVISVFVLQGSNRIFNCLCHCIYFALFSNVLVTDNSLDSGFHTREILILILVQGICLSNGFINLSIVRIPVLQSFNRIFNRFRHCIYFTLLCNIFTMDSSLQGSFHIREVLVVVLLQSIRLSNSFVNLSVISVFVLQGSNRIFNCLCHCIYFALFSNVLVTDNSLDSGFHTREILILILVQGICLSNGFINLSIVRIPVLQSFNRIFNRFRHCIYFTLLGNILTTDNSVDSGFHTSEILILILAQGIRLGNSLINFGVVRILVLQSCNRIFNCLCHCIYFALLGNIFATHNSVDSGIHSGEVLVVILIQSIRLRNGCIDLVIVRILVLQGCNRIFNCLRHCIHIALLSNVFTTSNSVDSVVYTREIFVVTLVQFICLGNSLIDLVIVRILILQVSNGIFDCFCHFIHFALLRNIFITVNSIDSGIHSGEVLVVILVQFICLGNSFINLSVVSILVLPLQGKGYDFTFSTVVFVGNGVFVTIHCQHVSIYCPTAPVACLGNVKVSRQGRKVKCAVIVNNDLVVVSLVIQGVYFCVADI